MLTRQVNAGDITGAPAIVPPEIFGDFSFLWSNDFLGRGGDSDENRTQQLGLQLNVSPQWGLVFDHSIITASENNPVLPGNSGRIDQVSPSLMYEVYRQQSDPDSLRLVQAGAGLRAYGDYGEAVVKMAFIDYSIVK